MLEPDWPDGSAVERALELLSCKKLDGCRVFAFVVKLEALAIFQFAGPQAHSESVAASRRSEPFLLLLLFLSSRGI